MVGCGEGEKKTCAVGDESWEGRFECEGVCDRYVRDEISPCVLLTLILSDLSTATSITARNLAIRPRACLRFVPDLHQS